MSRHPDSTPCWRIRLEADDASAPAIEDALAAFAQSVARFLASPGPPEGQPSSPRWRIDAICAEPPDALALDLALADAVRTSGAPVPDYRVDDITEKDWLAVNRRQFPPVRAGRFFVHGAYFQGAVPEGATALRLDAGPAFGSGAHATTRGCLLAIDALTSARRLDNALDLGCGSGILSLAIAKACGARIMATDIDPTAVRTTRANARANGVAGRITVLAGDGIAAAVRGRGPYDLVVANILAEPLIAMAPDIEGVLADGGAVVLSGLLTAQQDEVEAAYGALGLGVQRVIVLEEWSTIILRRRKAG